MPIKRSKAKEIDFKEVHEEPTFCQHCSKVGVISKLQARLYGKDEIPIDDENWLMCYRCGRLVEIYNIKHESERLKGFTEPSDDPFDFGRSEILGIKRDLKKPKDYDDIKDDNLRNELRKGSILLEYSDTEQ
jgi:hypothetical protein